MTNTIGERVSVIYREYIDGNQLRFAWHPKIEVNGKLMPVGDGKTSSKLVEAKTRKEAFQKAIDIRDNAKKRMEANNGRTATD